MIHRLIAWLSEFGRKQREKPSMSGTASTSRKRGRPKLSKSQKKNAKKKSK